MFVYYFVCVFSSSSFFSTHSYHKHVIKKKGRYLIAFGLVLFIIIFSSCGYIFPGNQKIGYIEINYPISSSKQFNEELDYLIYRGDINIIILRLIRLK